MIGSIARRLLINCRYSNQLFSPQISSGRPLDNCYHISGGYAFCSTRNEDVVRLTRMISEYSMKGEIDLARNVFDQMGYYRDSISWNVMIKCFIDNNRMSDARHLFDEMPERTSVSWNSVIMGYAKEQKPHVSLKLFLVSPHKGVVNSTAMITAMCRASMIEEARQLFDEIAKPNSISWSSIVSGFQQNGFMSESLNLFREMLRVGIQPTSHCFTSVLSAAADMTMLSISNQLYCQLLKRGFGTNTLVGNSAISMFIKSGSFLAAMQVFQQLLWRDLVSWNSLITGCSQNGQGVSAITIFHQMIKSRIWPDSVTFLAVLHGCSHSGFLEEGKRYFQSMQLDFGILPGPEHFACIVDLFSRAGLIGEAYEIMTKMPFVPTVIFWRTLLNGCRIRGDLGMGVYAADRILELEPHNSSACLMIIDIYNLAGRKNEVLEMRRRLREREERREPGCSWIDIKGRNHMFTTKDETHPESAQIYKVLELISYDSIP